jgi:hypothetical protein
MTTLIEGGRIVNDGQVFIDELLRLLFREPGKPEQWFVGHVQQVEYLLAVALVANHVCGYLDHPQSHLLPAVLGYTLVSARNLLWYIDMNLHPVYLLRHAPSLHVAGVVVRVIDGARRSWHVEILYKHTLLVEVGNAQGPLNVGHAERLSPLGNSIQQGSRHLKVVNEFYHREAYVHRMPFLVGALVDDTHDTAYRNFVSVSHKGLNVQCPILCNDLSLGNQSMDIVPQIRYILRAILVYIIRQVNEITHLFFASYLYYIQHL